MSFKTYLQNQPLDNKLSFKPVDSMQDLLSDPAKSLVIAGLVLLNTVGFNLNQNMFFTAKQSQTVVLGQAVSADVTEPGVLAEQYTLSLASLLRGYLEQRAMFASEQDSQSASDLSAGSAAPLGNWASLASLAREAILELKVPANYQTLHLWVSAILSEEMSLTAASLNSSSVEALNQRWADILAAYPWLNEIYQK